METRGFLIFECREYHLRQEPNTWGFNLFDFGVTWNHLRFQVFMSKYPWNYKKFPNNSMKPGHKKKCAVSLLKPRIWWFLAKKQLILGPWNQVTKKKKPTKMSHLSVKPQKFHRNWLSTNLKPPEVSKKLPHFDFTKRNRPSSIKTDTSQNCRQQPSWICRHVFFTQTR